MFVTNPTNLGAVETWNLGIRNLQEYSKYTAISVVHADDVLGEGFVGIALQEFLKRPEIDVIHFQPKIIGPTGRKILSIPDLYKALTNFQRQYKSCMTSGDDGLAEVLRSNFIYCPAMIFNMDRLETVSFDTSWKMVADLELVSRLIRSNHQILSLPSREYSYRRHPSSLTSDLTRSLDRFREEMMLYRFLHEECRRIGFTRSAEAADSKIAVRLNMLWTLLIRFLKLDFAGATALFQLFREETRLK